MASIIQNSYFHRHFFYSVQKKAGLRPGGPPVFFRLCQQNRTYIKIFGFCFRRIIHIGIDKFHGDSVSGGGGDLPAVLLNIPCRCTAQTFWSRQTFSFSSRPIPFFTGQSCQRGTEMRPENIVRCFIPYGLISLFEKGHANNSFYVEFLQAI